MLTILAVVLVLVICQGSTSEVAPMGTAFTYQGRLLDEDAPAEGLYDFEFRLYDDPDTGSQQGTTNTIDDLDVIDGYFVVELDFGSDVFTGDARWLHIAVRPGEVSDPNEYYTYLSPRQKVAPVPYALQTRGVFVDNSGNVGIGTTSPSEKLAVFGSIRSTSTTGGAIDGWGPSWGVRGQASALSGTNYGVFGKTYSSGGYAGYFVGGKNYFEGNVGIGTASPSAELDVNGHIAISYSDPYLRTDSTNKHMVISGGNGWADTGATMALRGADASYNAHGIEMYTGGEERVRIQSNGNVAIGTANPSTRIKLTVNGTIKGTDVTHDYTGVIGESYAGRGVVGHSARGSGVYGWTDDGYAGEFRGDVYVEGDVKIDEIGKGVVFPDGTKQTTAAGFPRPAFDSGWFSMPGNTRMTVRHDLGGNVDNYVVDMQFKYAGSIHQVGYGDEEIGCFWEELDTESIVVVKGDPKWSYVQQVRIRIWVYR
jgi:hypothetical protein